MLQSLQQGEYLDKILLQSNVQDDAIAQIRTLAAEAGVPVQRVPVEKLNYLNVYNHEGCVAYKARIQYQDLQAVVSQVIEDGQVPLFLLLDGVTDVRNIGAIARSAYAMGVQAIVIPEKGVGALNEDAVLTSAGALEHIHICRVNNLPDAIELLQLNGIATLATEMDAPQRVDAADLRIPVAFVLGAEEKGIQPAVRSACSGAVSIPMAGNFDSLNVSVATGMLLYEAFRQRNPAS